MKKSTNKKVRFELEALEGSKVSVAGTFNDWNAVMNPMKGNRNSGKFATIMVLSPGQHEYKFVVNGEWHVDPSAPTVLSKMGTINNVVQV